MKRSALLLWIVSTQLVAATFTVTNTDDSGAGSLRQAMDDANATPGPDVPVKPTCPAKLAPIAAQTAAISSSA